MNPRIKIEQGGSYCIVTAHGDLKGLTGWADKVTTTGFGHSHFDLRPFVGEGRLYETPNLRFRVRDTDVMPVSLKDRGQLRQSVDRNEAILKEFA